MRLTSCTPQACITLVECRTSALQTQSADKQVSMNDKEGGGTDAALVVTLIYLSVAMYPQMYRSWWGDCLHAFTD